MTRGAIQGAMLAVLLGAAACASRQPVPISPPPPPAVDWAARIARADALVAAGHYVALREARGVYEAAAAVHEWRAAVLEKFVRVSIALALREKELGILPGPASLDPAAVVAADPSLAFYATPLELLARLPCKIKGHPGLDESGGPTLEDRLDWVNARIVDIDGELGERAERDDLAATLRVALRGAFFYKFPGGSGPALPAGLHAGSRQLAFETAVVPDLDADRLEALLAADPGFSEVNYYLGEVALLGGKLLTAEGRYLAALEKIPGSLSVLISLAKVAFQMEELEPCLGYNETALGLLPTYRDALLGRALCLGYLGRSQEALASLSRILELGGYYIGEAHYWTAWNFNELGRLDEARKAVDAAKVFLVGLGDVMTLSGIVAYRQGRLDDAEKDLRRALDLEPLDSDAAYHLGRLYADRKEWLNSGIYFAGAALSLEQKEADMEKKVREIEASEMAAERKARLVAKKRYQIAATQATKATCQYNGAAGYHNAGVFDRALALAQLAAAHPAFADKAAELIKMIRER